MRAEFTDDLITGNELIDSQHEELIGWCGIKKVDILFSRIS